MHQLEILKNLQILTISLFDCDSSEIEEKSSELFIYFHEIELGNKEQFPIYEAYLHFLKHISLIKKISLKNLNIPYLILKELITNHSLKDNFHQSTIVNLFESNKLLSLFLYDQKVIDQTAWELLIMRCQKTDFTPNHIFLAYYWPEIVENPEIYNEVTALKPTVSNIFQDLNNPPNLNKFKHIRDSGYSNNPLAAIIRKDDITTFLRYIRSNPDININSKIICLFFDTPISTLIQNGKISPLDYSTFYGAIKIFKYLWANHAPMSENTVECCIAGGNNEIFHIVINIIRFYND